jgi:hypothetical protein
MVLLAPLATRAFCSSTCPKPANHPEIVFGLGDGDLNHPLQALIHTLEIVQGCAVRV